MIYSEYSPVEIDPARIMKGAEPEFHDGGGDGFLFFHGFSGSPYEGREFARYFSQLGYTVWVPLLPGHGTRPKDMNNVTWQEWYFAARYYWEKLSAKCRRVVVCGQSMGGCLALHLAAHHPVDALITLSGPVFLTDWRLKLLPFAKHFLQYQYKSKGPDIHSQQAKRKSADYPKYPVKSVLELQKLLEHVRNDISEISAPTLLVHSRKDHTVSFENLDYIYRRIGSQVKKKLILEKSYHVISVDLEKEKVLEAVQTFLAENQAPSAEAK